MLPPRPIVTIVLFLGSIAIAVFLVFPTYEKFRVVSQDLQNARKEYQYLSEYYANLEKLQEGLLQYESALKKIDAALPQKLSLPALFAYLLQATSQNGLVLVEFGDPSTEASNIPSIKDTSIELSLSGAYDSLKNFLGSLYRNAKLIDIQSISFSAPADEAFDFKVRIKTHSY